MGKYFGTDGFRGEAGRDITAEHAFKVGRAAGRIFAKEGGRCRAVIGKDTRRSSYMLEYALCAGLTASGADAYIMHVTTTPSVSYIARCDGFDCGVMISASHNPYSDNGIKLMNGQGEKIDGGKTELIESYLEGGYSLPLAAGEEIGRTVDYVSGRNRYTGHLISLSTCSYKGLKIGIDGANGSAFSIAKSVFDALGARTYSIGCSPDGLNINDGVGSTHTEKLQKLVTDNGLDIAFAFDGDADRCIAVDERGGVLTGDEQLFILAKLLASRGELAGGKVVCTTMSNGGLSRALKGIGAESVTSEVGDRFVAETMQRTGAVLGGERSGHIIMTKYGGTGDGIVTAIMIMEALIASKRPASALVKGYKPLPQTLVNLPVKDRETAAAAALAEAERLGLRSGVRLVVRPSGTERLIRVMAEGERYEDCVYACDRIRAAVLAASDGDMLICRGDDGNICAE